MESSNIGKKWNHEVAQGKDWGPFVVTLTDPDGNPIDVTDYLFRGVVRKTPGSASEAATITTEIVDGSAGKISFTIGHEETAAVECGDTIKDPKSHYVWEYEMETGAGLVSQLFHGDWKIQKELTR